MGEQWEFFQKSSDAPGSYPRSIALDMSMGEGGADAGFPLRATLCVRLNRATPEGLPISEELEALNAIELDLERSLKGVPHRCAGRETARGEHALHFYLPGNMAEAWETLARDTLARHPGHWYEISLSPDSGWELYFKGLYPSAQELDALRSKAGEL